jgi:cell wall-associated NlpC family hydrolase
LAGDRVASQDDLLAGDVVIFSSSPSNRIADQVGIYISDGVFIHLADPSVGVVEETLDTDYYKSRYLTGRRVIH